MDVTDRPAAVRQGEAFETQAVEQFLKDTISGLDGSLAVAQFPSGFSNLTYMIRVGDREMILRRPPFGTKARSAHDMSREYRILSALHPIFPYAPKPLAYTDDPAIMGCPFYVMERIKGIILRKDLPEGLTLSPNDARRLCENLIDVHLELHAIDYRQAGLEDFGRPEGYVQRQVQGWSRRYVASRTDDAPDFEPIMAWLHDKMPPATTRHTIIHNDYKLDNVVLDPDSPLHIIGILDWEMATVGDPLMDLGNSLAYWVQADDPEDLQSIRLMPTNIPGALTREELVARYCEKSGTPPGNFDFYYCFGLFRLAVIAQQIYYRYYHGQTRDRRFKTLIVAVHNLGKAASRLMEHTDL
jgi:aminoglycoside phosphotransferase (APT) family kinase protein